MVQAHWIEMVDVLQFIFSHFPDVQTDFYLARHELISNNHSMVRAFLLPIALFWRGGRPPPSAGECDSDFDGRASRMVSPQ
jgi:hypothetical protein